MADDKPIEQQTAEELRITIARMRETHEKAMEELHKRMQELTSRLTRQPEKPKPKPPK